MLIKSLAAIALVTAVVAAQTAQTVSSTGRSEPSYTTAQRATEAENYLESHPEDRTVVQRLLDYYVQRWQNTQVGRLRVILWTIANHPDIALDRPHDNRGLLLNPDDREGYQRARQLWLEQVRRYPDDPRVLENAAICLRLSDRESAANWLKQAMALDPARRERIVMALADVYAAAITGVTGENPWESSTSLDPAEPGSGFALRARTEAMANSETAARTGWALYLTTEAFHRYRLSDADYDALAEELLLKAAALDYPKPATLSLLGTFYERQERKPSGQIHPRSRLLVVAPDEQAKRLLSGTPSITVTGEKTVLGPVHVMVDIVVGVDGHVWKAVPRNAPSEAIGSAVSSGFRTCLYQPLEDLGEPVRVSTTVDAIVDVRR